MSIHLVGRKYKEQMVPDHTSGALITTGGISAVGLRRKYQKTKRCDLVVIGFAGCSGHCGLGLLAMGELT